MSNPIKTAARSLPARETVRIGYQKSSTLITLLKTQGTLEKTLAENNIDVTWGSTNTRRAQFFVRQ